MVKIRMMITVLLRKRGGEPFVNFLSFLNSPASKISVSFSILSCSAAQARSSALVGNSELIVSESEWRASSPTKTSIGGIRSNI